MVNGAATARQPVTTAEAEAVRAEVRRICASPQFATAGKLLRFLEFIVEETLENAAAPVKEYSIGLAAYGRPADYDPRTDSIVRVEAGKLRSRLAQYYDESGRDDAVRISVPKGGYVPTFDFAGQAVPAFTPQAARSRKPLVLSLLAAIVVVLALITYRSIGDGGIPRYSRLQRLSPGHHLALDPASSPDGRSIAYVSDAGGSWLKIWIRDVATGQEHPVTKDAANDSCPSFSSDGRWIAFRSDRSGGGIYLVHTTGGEPVLLVPRGREPRFSPAGLLLAYWIANDEETGEFGRAFLLDAGRYRGPYPKAEPLFSGFAHVRSPVWSDNGRYVAAMGTLQSDIPEKEYDAWTTAIEKGHATSPPVKTGIVPLLKTRGFFTSNRDRNRIRAGAWLKGSLYLTVPNGDQSTLVRVSVSPWSGKSRGVESVLPGTELFSAPFVLHSTGLVFAGRRLRYGVWSVPSLGGASALKIASPESEISALSVSQDGSVVVWQSTLTRRGQSLIALDVASGTETELARGMVDHPIVSPDGHWVAWRVMDGTSQAIDSAGIREPAKVQRLCEDCGTPISWTPDGRRILFQTGDPNTAIGVLDVVERKRAPVLSHPSHALYGPRYLPAGPSSTDGWLLFYAATGAGTRQIFVSALHNFRPSPETRWVPITDGRDSDVDPCWSEAGDLIYFVSQRSSTRGIWAQRVDAHTKQPIGSSFLVYAPPTPSQSLLSTSPIRRATGLTAAAGRLFFAMDEAEGSIWVLEARAD